jgi:tRNA U34 2-thiouridine synthase MnmA/TrmU
LGRDIKKHKAVGLFSGGLDSSLAVKVIAELDFDVIAFHLCHPFETGGPERAFKLAEATRRLGARLHTEPAGDEYLEVVRSPKYGYGKAMNPCIDCHAYMVKRAASLAERCGAAFVFTGEVLGSRPMSQRREALNIVEKESGLAGRLLRPLSAKLLPPTEMEASDLVDRERLYGIKGRSRKQQIKLAAEFGITDYPTPAGGCLLTEVGYSAKLKDAFEHGETGYSDISLLRVGRHFRLPDGGKAIIGRNETENGLIEARLSSGDLLLEVKNVGSPVTLLRNSGPGDLEPAAALTVRYSDARNAPGGIAVSVREARDGSESTIVAAFEPGLEERFRVTA